MACNKSKSPNRYARQMGSVYSKKDEHPEFWFNLKTLKVEVGKKSAAPYRVGPFATEGEAKHALDIIAKRNDQWRSDEERSA